MNLKDAGNIVLDEVFENDDLQTYVHKQVLDRMNHVGTPNDVTGTAAELLRETTQTDEFELSTRYDEYWANMSLVWSQVLASGIAQMALVDIE